MTMQVNRHGSLVESDGCGYTWIVGGIKCDTSEVNERTMLIGIMNKCFTHNDVLDFSQLFSFTLAINDWK